MGSEALKKMEIPGRIAVQKGNGDLPKLNIITDWSTAEIYLQGAHVTAFQKKGEPPVLFTSQSSRYEAGQPIRGGVPIIFPWFGPKEGKPAHGFARNIPWELHETNATPDGGATLRFHPGNAPAAAELPAFSANYIVTITDRLRMDLIVTNLSDRDLVYENCLHTYFQIGDISKISVRGLKGLEYLDKTDNSARKREPENNVYISGEVDRTFLNTQETIEIFDSSLARTILVEKKGSASTVVWNPWIDKAKAMPDFGDDE
ncbi:MAG: Aldose 1-epimerase [Verrucomicrobiales bacterium]|nr:Aldose 1-epimerase [Verrucomicrobiales bacterium]